MEKETAGKGKAKVDSEAKSRLKITLNVTASSSKAGGTAYVGKTPPSAVRLSAQVLRSENDNADVVEDPEHIKVRLAKAERDLLVTKDHIEAQESLARFLTVQIMKLKKKL